MTFQNGVIPSVHAGIQHQRGMKNGRSVAIYGDFGGWRTFGPFTTVAMLVVSAPAPQENHCHSERSEESPAAAGSILQCCRWHVADAEREILHFVQNDVAWPYVQRISQEWNPAERCSVEETLAAASIASTLRVRTSTRCFGWDRYRAA